MSISQLEFLRHILDECDFINELVRGKAEQDIINDPVCSRAVVRSLEIIGEAAKKVDDEFKRRYPRIEWRKMAGMRDRLIHHYIGIDYTIVWEVICDDIPLLTDEIRSILSGS